MEARLTYLRQRIDEIDAKLSELVSARINVAKQIGEIKKENGIPVTDDERETLVVERWNNWILEVIGKCKEVQ